MNPTDSAFATASSNGFAPGLTKRELLAAMMMQGLNANREYQSWAPTELAKLALSNADALIRALGEIKRG